MPNQLEAFYRKVRIYSPFESQQTAYANGYAVCDDDQTYLVKCVGAPTDVPATEWLGSALADSLNLPVPEYRVLQMVDGSLAFGSKMVVPKLSDIEAGQLLFGGPLANEFAVPDLTSVLASTFVLDLFLGNDDRHDQNFMFALEQAGVNRVKTARIKIFDFNSSSILTREVPELPMHRQTHTVKTARLIHKVHGFDMAAAQQTLSRLRQRSEFMFEDAMLGLPPEWLPQERRGQLLARVSRANLAPHLDRLERELVDGTYF